MIKVLFVCTGNTCRSPMAKALLMQKLRDHHGEEKVRVESAGLGALDGLPASQEASEVLQKAGLDISGHRSQPIREKLVRDADIILTMTAAQRDFLEERFPAQSAKIHTLGEFAGGETAEVEDPYGQGLQAYRRSFDQIEYLISRIVIKIVE